MRRWRRWVAATVGATALVWGVIAVRGHDTGPLVLQSRGHTVLVAAPLPYGVPVVGVGIFGIVTDRHGCLGLDGRTAVWPAGTKVINARPLTLLVPTQGAVRIGDHIVGGGGISETGDGPPGMHIPTACRTPELVHLMGG